MIDADGFRANVGIILANTQGQVLLAKRIEGDSWQFPQGGIHYGETPMDAMYRELYEELGLLPHHVRVLGVTKDWLRYRLPKRFIRFDTSVPEFDQWQWVSYWYPLGQVVAFKKGVYQKALFELLDKLPSNSTST